ncbi:hypothetical protein NDU88_004743 [Pleurodeles waltl]|uniref:Secreted protein n=1 Tax=Pleurodeles waltl TaxID=8319 RepID=A0AAV7V2K9_PLEWA|nr:hypothetical protein NDU88_004743 [Pleurodeles waltl]
MRVRIWSRSAYAWSETCLCLDSCEAEVPVLGVRPVCACSKRHLCLKSKVSESDSVVPMSGVSCDSYLRHQSQALLSLSTGL